MKNGGSLDILKVLDKCGLTPNDRNQRGPVVLETPSALAIIRPLQVSAALGFSRRTRWITGSNWSSVYVRGRPRAAGREAPPDPSSETGDALGPR